MWLLRSPAPRASLARLSLDVRPAETLNAGGLAPTFVLTLGGSRTALAWTPDGQALVFVGRRAGIKQLYVRRLDAAEARPLAGTEGAQVPAISLDGQWVAFWAHGAIRKVPLGGGPVTDLASAIRVPPLGLAWDARSRVFFGSVHDGRIWQVSTEGALSAVTTVGEQELAHVLPCPLPGGQALLYTVRKREWTWGDEEIVAQTLATGERKVLLRDAADVRYVPTGHLVFLRRGQLFAVPFDAERVEVRGTPMAVLDAVAQALTAGNSGDVTGAGQFAIAATGTLAWLPGPVAPYEESALVMVDRRGQVSPLSAPLRAYDAAVRLSPDGRRLAATVHTLTEVGAWIYDLGRGTLTPLAGGGRQSTRSGRRTGSASCSCGSRTAGGRSQRSPQTARRHRRSSWRARSSPRPGRPMGGSWRWLRSTPVTS
jgi:serine/threonine-protein kinase